MTLPMPGPGRVHHPLQFRQPAADHYYARFNEAMESMELGMRLDRQARDAAKLAEEARDLGCDETANRLETANAAILDAREAL